MSRMTPESLSPPLWIDTVAGLRTMVADLSAQASIAVDTESNSLHAYREQVCLLQFSTPENDYLVDPLALADLSLLGPVFANPRIEKVFHAAEYDLICLSRDFDFQFTNLFDTMQAARILGYHAVGLDSLLAAKFGVGMSKRHQKADWASRPLSRDLIHYARLDTHYLLRLRHLLQSELEARGLWMLAEEDFRRACQINGPRRKATIPAWERLAGQHDLTPRQLTILSTLCACRERIAERMDRPIFRVMSDAQLVELARAAPLGEFDLFQSSLSSRQIRLWGSEILRAVRRGLGAPPVKRRPATGRDEAFLARLEALKNWRKRVARSMGVESDIVLPRAYVYSLAEKAPCTAQELAALLGESPWRLERFGAQILAVLQK